MIFRKLPALILSCSGLGLPLLFAETLAPLPMHPVGQAPVAPAPSPSDAKSKPSGQVFKSHIVTEETVGHAVKIDIPLSGASKLYLVVTDGGNSFACDWADWVNPRITTESGEVNLTDLKWEFAKAGFGEVQINKNSGGQPLIVNSVPVTNGIGTHANSVICYSLPAGTTRFQASGGLDAGGVKQGGGTSVQFQVWTSEPKLGSGENNGSGGARSPEASLAALDVADGLEAATFASEPMLLSPSSMDIDAKGRVWVAEIVNYRGHNGKRPEGDRILILEDLDHDGKADKQKVFYQGKDLISPHGVTVLDGAVIVSAGDKVLRMVDADHNDEADKVEVIFSGIHGTQHDHGIHAFHFGPDGKFYFNFGNAGEELKDAKGQPIKDLAGNTINSARQPYNQGMVFRCDEDFTHLETLGWNFRNNWECNVDSYGTIWQSDNDDDGNKSVRINYVMEFGNYGYTDEMTGQGWQKGDAKTEEEVQIAHWHLKDPGVMPNLLQTGGGSPTGILVYEGNLLPKAFQNQIIHCDAGPNIVRAYQTTVTGAGYKAVIQNLLEGARDRWFRPSDVSVAPDGSLLVADWYDPGVGGHGMGDLDRGRVYRVAPAAVLRKYAVPALDLSTPAGMVEALKNPNENTRYLAWKALQAKPEAARQALEKLWQTGLPHEKARAMWALGKLTKQGPAMVQAALVETDPNLRIAGLRLARQLGLDLLPLVKSLVKDASPAVRRECAVSLRFLTDPAAADLWAALAMQHDGVDKWYLAGLHIGAQLKWDASLSAWQKTMGDAWDTPGGRDIIWTSRAKLTSELLAKILTKSKISPEEKLRFVRAFDFQSDAATRQAALRQILEQL